MDVIVLTGGRGARMGALTTRMPKAVLRFRGSSLLERVLKCVDAVIPEGARILVATGYRAGGVKQEVLRIQREGHLGRGITVLPPEDQPLGGVRSTVHALKQAQGISASLILGIDAVFPESLLKGFVDWIRTDPLTPALVLSPHLEIAPSHGAVQIDHDSTVRAYWKHSRDVSNNDQSTYYSTVGIRYLSRHHARCLCGERLSEEDFEYHDAIPRFLARGIRIRGYVNRNRWVHFGAPSDFAKPDLEGVGTP